MISCTDGGAAQLLYSLFCIQHSLFCEFPLLLLSLLLLLFRSVRVRLSR
jgi:hypothetical protein